jgi:hypothetical protein
VELSKTVDVRVAAAAFAFYVVVAIAITWPVALGAADHIAIDLGDPAFVAFVLAWGSKHWLELLGGDLSAPLRFWTAPIFYPEPLTTAYSEHFALHSLLTLPVFALTRNAVLCYNVWFVATFALSGFCMFLLVRAMTGREWGALVAGLAFAVAPYRFAALSHLQVLSSFWMPLVLLGLHQFVANRRRRSLVLAGTALWAQWLASGYYLVYFTPFAALFAVVELTVRRRLADLRAWIALAVCGAAAIGATFPFVWPYLAVQRSGSFNRQPAEVQRYSADLAAWVTANPALRLWGRLHAYGDVALFPGVAALAMLLLGFAIAIRRLRSPEDELRLPAAIILFFGLITIVVTVWMSLGPAPTLMGAPLAIPSLYRALYEYVPGYDAVRVPIRVAMITALASSLVAGLAASAFDRAGRRWLLALAAAAILGDAVATPLPVDLSAATAPHVRPPDRLFAEDETPPIYRYLKTLPADAVIAELPFGVPEWEIQFSYYSVVHGHRIVNGYSGNFPQSYASRFRPLEHPERTFGTMYSRLTEDGVTHVVVHVDAWRDDSGRRIVDIFEGTGFARLAKIGNDYVFSLALQR